MKFSATAACEGFWSRFLFAQPNVERRFALARISVGTVVAVLVLFGPFDGFFSDHIELYQPRGLLFWFPPMSEHALACLRAAVVLSAVCTAIGLQSRIATCTAACTFFLLNGYTANFTFPVFNYNTHLNFLLLALALGSPTSQLSLDAFLRTRAGNALSKQRRRGGTLATHSRAEHERKSFALAFMQLVVVLIYGQAFLAKLLLAGPEWFLTGEVIRREFVRYGLPAGRALSQIPELFPWLGIYTGLFEAGIGVALLSPGAPARLAVIAIAAFHLGVYITMNISFWHVVLLLPALFWIDNEAHSAATVPSTPSLVSR